jgi:hypothetical protein
MPTTGMETFWSSPEFPRTRTPIAKQELAREPPPPDPGGAYPIIQGPCSPTVASKTGNLLCLSHDNQKAGSATITDTSHGGTRRLASLAFQYRSRQRRWPKGPDFTGQRRKSKIKSAMQPLLEHCMAPHHPDCRAEPILIVALHVP